MPDRLVNRTNPLRFLMRYVPVPWVFVLAYLFGFGLQYVVPVRPPAGEWRALNIAGGGLFVAGAGLAAWGWLTFLRARTTTVPGEASSRLVTWGPYRFTRNPMYAGLTVAYLGEAAILKHIWPVALLPLVLIYLNSVVIPVEERKLGEGFGDAYEQYRQRVRRWV